MRLINVRTYQFKEFFEGSIPPYAIISHRWGENEISFKDYRRSLKREGEGYNKIIDACVLARSRGLEWIWLDSCCIDKRSSAELSEAINSMYRWYEQSGECYVYMADVSFDVFERDENSRLHTFRQSDWFNRGWTLQELIAPNICIFCDYRWRIIGRKLDLVDEISQITQIDPAVLRHPVYLGSISPREVMSWASRRKTTRPEDLAYCLFGLFNVNMPLLYGEGGTRAFVRLQLEILKTSDDESLFDWGYPDACDWSKEDGVRRSGLLATSPDAFADDPNLYPPCPPYAPPPDPYMPVDHLDPHDLFKRAQPILLPTLGDVEIQTGCPPYTWSWAPPAESTIGTPFSTTKKGFVLNRVATMITWLGLEYYVIDLNCRPRNRFLSSIVLQQDVHSGLATRVHYYGHGEDLRRRVGAMQPKNIGMRQFHVSQWMEYTIDTFSPDPAATELQSDEIKPLNLPPPVPKNALNKLL